MTERVEVKFVKSEALRIGPDEVLVVKLGDVGDTEQMEHLLKSYTEAFEHVGLGGRVLICAGDVELTVVPRWDSLARPARSLEDLT